MYTIVEKEYLNPTVCRITVNAANAARHAKAGQFVIIIPTQDDERIPLTISSCDTIRGTVSVIFQILGTTTLKLSKIPKGKKVFALVGPLGKPTELTGCKNVAVIGGGVGNAIAYPIAKAFHDSGIRTTVVAGFRNRDLIILEEEYRENTNNFVIMTDDGSYGGKGLVTDALKALIEGGEKFDRVIAIGPMIMMKFVSLLTKQYDIPTVVSMNATMVDGTGMCGCCRLNVGGVTKFACVDGPDFDGHLVDFDEALSRGGMYRAFEQKSYEDTCKLFEGVQNG